MATRMMPLLGPDEAPDSVPPPPLYPTPAPSPWLTRQPARPDGIALLMWSVVAVAVVFAGLATIVIVIAR